MSGTPERRRKRLRSEPEIAALAERLGRKWQPGDPVETWLRRNVRGLTVLVRDRGWSWDDVGRALERAGITYGSGRWTGDLLAKKAAKARAMLRRKAEEQAARRTTPTRSQKPPPSQEREPDELTPESTTQEFSVATPQWKPPPKSSPETQPATLSGVKQDPDEAIDRLLGRRRHGAVPMPEIPKPEDE